MSSNQKSSSFTKITTITDATELVGLDSGQNVTTTYKVLKDTLGVTGTIQVAGDPAGVPILSAPTAGDYYIRNVEVSKGIMAATSAQDGVMLSNNFVQGTLGTQPIADLTAAQYTFRSFQAGTGISIAGGTDTMTITATGTVAASNTIPINEESDFPIQDATTITLSSKKIYDIGADITTTKRFVCEDGVVFTGRNQLGNTVTYTGTDAMFTGVGVGAIIEDIKLDSPNASQTFDFTDASGTKILKIQDIQIANTLKWGTYSGFITTETLNSNSQNADDGLTISGSGQLITKVSDFAIVSTSATCKQIELTATSLPKLEINDVILSAPAGAVQLVGLASNANITAGTIAQVSSMLVLGGASQLSGIAQTDFRYDFLSNNEITNTRPEATISAFGRTDTTTIAASSSDGTSAVKANIVWTVDTSSHFTADTTGTLTYIGERPFTTPIDFDSTVLMTSGSSTTIAGYIKINSMIHRATAGVCTPTSSKPESLRAGCQFTLVTGDTVEYWYENRDNTTNIITESATGRVN